MREPLGQEVYRGSSYYASTGLLRSVYFDSLSPSDTVTFVYTAYQYDAVGFPSHVHTFGNGISGAWNSTFAHDNLGRLTRWGTGQCCNGFDVGVSYGYDADGNLTSRGWDIQGAAEAWRTGRRRTRTAPSLERSPTTAVRARATPRSIEPTRGVVSSTRRPSRSPTTRPTR